MQYKNLQSLCIKVFAFHNVYYIEIFETFQHLFLNKKVIRNVANVYIDKKSQT